MYFVMPMMLLMTSDPIRIWSNPALKLNIIMKCVSMGKTQLPEVHNDNRNLQKDQIKPIRQLNSHLSVESFGKKCLA